MKFGRHRGVSIVECLILIIVLGITMGGIISTVLWASDLTSFNRAELGMRTVAASVFESLEAISPADLDANFDLAVAGVITTLGGNVGGSGNILGGFTLDARSISSVNGVRTISLTISVPSSKKRMPLVLERCINSFSEDTVDDVLDG
jgi:hypothetical protein